MSAWDDVSSAASDVGNAAASAASTVGDAVEGAGNAAVDTVQDGINKVIDGIQGGLQWGEGWVCVNARRDLLCSVGNVVLGAIDGFLQGVQDTLNDTFSIIRDVIGIVGSLLRLDLAGVLHHLGDLLIHSFKLGIDAFRFITLGSVIGGIVAAFEREALRKFVSHLLNSTFGAHPQRLANIRDFVRIDRPTWGFPLPAEHRVFRLDSRKTPLWQWHNEGFIDLYQLAGLLSFDSFQVQRPRTVVRLLDAPLFPVDRYIISKHIESHGDRFPLEVWAMSRAAVAEKLKTASDRHKKMAIRLLWNDSDNFSWFQSYTMHDISTKLEYRFDIDTLEQYLVDRGLRTLPSQNCTLLALGAFHYKEADGKERFGFTVGRSIAEGADSSRCATSGRTDSCCNTVELRKGSGVIHRDVWPNLIFRYVLAHEIGHYLGLCHFGHDGFQNIMWTKEPDAHVSIFSWDLWSYWYDGEPHFTLKDGKNTWRFIVDQFAVCFPAT
jgi:hypothetical protein